MAERGTHIMNICELNTHNSMNFCVQGVIVIVSLLEMFVMLTMPLIAIQRAHAVNQKY